MSSELTPPIAVPPCTSAPHQPRRSSLLVACASLPCAARRVEVADCGERCRPSSMGCVKAARCAQKSEEYLQ